MTVCGLTLLEPKPPRTASKTYGYDPDGEMVKLRDYDLGWQFRAHEVTLRGLDDLAEVVAGLADRDAFVVRGALAPGADPHRANRRMNPNEPGDKPSIVARARRWLLADIDHMPVPGGSTSSTRPTTRRSSMWRCASACTRRSTTRVATTSFQTRAA